MAKYTVLYDPSIATANIGDEIIVDSVKQELHECLPNQFIVRLPSHDYLGRVGRKWIRKSNYCIVGGTNLLSSNYLKFRQWKFTLIDALLLRQKLILMGVGWWQYQRAPDFLTAILYRMILIRNADIYHSVRDQYTKEMLIKLGISNVLNTACPTMWKLTDDHCRNIPVSRGKSAVVTLTDYSKDIDADLHLYRQIKGRYSEVIAWPQGLDDKEYFDKLGITNIIEPGLTSLDRVLYRSNIDYVGTRLHAGIRALQHGCRSLIIAVDNRAKEISKDTDLWVVDRNDYTGIDSALDAERPVKLRLPFDQIAKWKANLIGAVAERNSI